jgi:hypothetical protein
MNLEQQIQYELMMEYSPSTACRYAQFVSRESYLKELTEQAVSRRQSSKKKQEKH